MALRIMRAEERARTAADARRSDLRGRPLAGDEGDHLEPDLARSRHRADELADFDEYALAYHEAWSEPITRWLLSTVPTAMIFDDHEVHAQWKISRDWQDELEAKDWYEQRISGALVAYWIFQHIGNLSLRELGAPRAA